MVARLAMRAKSETARVAAIKELLDRGYGNVGQFFEENETAAQPPGKLIITFVRPDGEHLETLSPQNHRRGPVGQNSPHILRQSAGWHD